MHNLLDALELNNVLEGAEFVAFDFETTGLHPIESDPLGLSVVTDKGGGYVPLVPYRTLDDAIKRPPENKEIIAQILRNAIKSETIWVGWNLKFDLHMLQKLCQCVPKERIVDAEVGLWLLSEESSMALKPVMQSIYKGELESFKDLLSRGQELLNKENDLRREFYVKSAPKGKRGEYRRAASEIFPVRKIENDEVPIEWIAPYGYKDSLFTAFLWFTYIKPNLQSDNLLPLFYTYEMPLHFILFEMEQRGIKIDKQKLYGLAEEGKIKLNDLEQQIYNMVGREINCRSSLQLCQYLFDEKGFEEPSLRTKEGNPSLREESLKELYWKYKKQEPIFKLLLDHREISKAISTYSEALPNSAVDGRVHCRYNQTGTATGRLSSEMPNLQNLPRTGGIREAFIASDAFSLIKGDLSQAELRLLAHYSQDPQLLAAYQAGKDLHLVTMEQLGLSNRVLAKRLNFGTSYGIGPTKYQQLLLFEEEIYREYADCEQDIKNFYKHYVGISKWKKEVIEEINDNKYIESLFGRRRHLGGIFNADKSLKSYAERQGINFLIQGSVADIIKACMIKVEEMLHAYGGYLLTQTHDELLAEVPEECAEDAAHDLKIIMENLVKLDVPIKAEVGVGKNWKEITEIT